MRLEALAVAAGAGAAVETPDITFSGDPLVLDTVQLVSALVAQRRHGVPVDLLAASFHERLARGIADACVHLGAKLDAQRVALSGGVFQNALLVQLAREALEARTLRVLTHRLVPPNDGGLALGQAAIAGYPGRVRAGA